MAERDDTQALFRQFLEVCNRAMQAHKDEFPYKHIWEAAEELQAENGLHVTVYDDEPKGDYQLRLHDKHVELMREADEAEVGGWRINKSFLRKVAENPEAYIQDPSQLDWQWLKQSDFRD